MTTRFVGLAVVAMLMLVAAAIYLVLNPLPWMLEATDRAPAVARHDARHDVGAKGETKRAAEASRVTRNDAGARANGGATREDASRAPYPGVFDVARIDPDGVSVFAGQAKPNETVTVLVDGFRVGTTTADASGEWVVTTDRKLASANPMLGIIYGEKPPIAGRLASANPVGDVARPSGAGETADMRRLRSVREVEAGLLRKLGDLVDTARREAPAVASTGTAQGASGSQNGPSPAPAVAPVVTTTTTGSPGSAAALARGASGPGTIGATDGRAAGSGREAVGAREGRFAIASATPAAGGPAAAVSSRILPVPIRFTFREAALTPNGRAAATLLLEYLRIKKIETITLTGHADERGAHELNMELSSERLAAVSAFLRAGGYRGTVKLVPKGKLEPFGGVDRSKFDKDALYEFDRRVELMLAQ